MDHKPSGFRRAADFHVHSFFRKAPKVEVDLGDFLQLRAFRQQAGNNRRPLHNIAEIAVRPFRAARPTPAAAFHREKIGPESFAAEIETPQLVGRAVEGGAQVPVFVADVETRLVAPLGIASQQTRDTARPAPLLFVPAIEAFEVGAAMMEVEIFGIELFGGQSAQKHQEHFEFAVAESVALVVAEQDVEFVVVARNQIEAEAGKHSQVLDSFLAVQQFA